MSERVRYTMESTLWVSTTIVDRAFEAMRAGELRAPVCVQLFDLDDDYVLMDALVERDGLTTPGPLMPGELHHEVFFPLGVRLSNPDKEINFTLDPANAPKPQ